MSTGEVMAQLMRQQNRQQGERKRKTSDEPCGMLGEELEGVEEFVQRGRIALRVGHRELRAGNEASAKGQKK